MKAQSFSLALLLFTISCSNNGMSVNELKFGGLKGNVSSYKEFVYDAEEKFGEVVPDDLEGVTIYEYDKDGHQIKFGIYDEDGDVIYKYEDTFEKGVLVSRTAMQRYGDKRTESRIVERNKNYLKWCHEYGTANEYTTEVFYEKNFLCEKENGEKMLEIVYDKEGREIDRKRYLDGELSSRIKNEYNDAGLLVKSIQYGTWNLDKGDVLTYKYVEFDKKGNWVTSHVYENGELEAIQKREIIYR